MKQYFFFGLKIESVLWQKNLPIYVLRPRKTHVINETCIDKFFFSKLVRKAGLLVSTAFVFWA